MSHKRLGNKLHSRFREAATGDFEVFQTEACLHADHLLVLCNLSKDFLLSAQSVAECTDSLSME